jgi:hypothetical protein
VQLIEVHPLSLTGSRRNVRWLSGRANTPTFCVFSVFSVAFTEKCCDACGDGEYYFRSGCSTTEGAQNLVVAGNTISRSIVRR